MPANETTQYLLIGGGCASAAAAVGIRELDPSGRVIIVAGENRLPYDRPPLSKGFLKFKPADAADVESKDPSFYSDKNVEVISGVTATRLDRSGRSVELSDGRIIFYQKLLIATGSTPRTLSAASMEPANVFLLRSVAQAEAIREAAKHAKRAVLIGGGYIGLEVAATLKDLGLDVTVVHKGPAPWSHFSSPISGNFVQGHFEDREVKFVTNDHVEEIVSSGVKLTARTGGGRALAADMVVVGIGVALNTKLAVGCGIAVDAANAVIVGPNLHIAGDQSIFAAGDVASFPDPNTGIHGHVEHHMNAKWTGLHAGQGMAGKIKPYARVAYGYSDVFDLSMVVRGTPTGSRSARIVGDIDTCEFVELYEGSSNRVTCAIGFTRDAKQYDRINDALEDLVARGISARTATTADVGLER